MKEIMLKENILTRITDKILIYQNTTDKEVIVTIHNTGPGDAYIGARKSSVARRNVVIFVDIPITIIVRPGQRIYGIANGSANILYKSKNIEVKKLLTIFPFLRYN